MPRARGIRSHIITVGALRYRYFICIYTLWFMNTVLRWIECSKVPYCLLDENEFAIHRRKRWNLQLRIELPVTLI